MGNANEYPSLTKKGLVLHECLPAVKRQMQGYTVTSSSLGHIERNKDTFGQFTVSKSPHMYVLDCERKLWKRREPIQLDTETRWKPK